MKCIMDFGKVSSLFTLQNLVMLRIANLLNLRIFNKYKKLFRFTIDFPLILIFLISITPKFILKLFAVLAVLVWKKNKLININKIMSK